MVDIQNLAIQILEFTQSKSVFLYGSRARDDFTEHSDYEIGVLMKESNYIERSVLKKKFNIQGINIFPFRYEKFIKNNPDTPFVKPIYMYELIRSGKTLAGEEVIKNLTPPPITLLDLIKDVRFNLGYALAATHSYKNGDIETSSMHMAKSCLFATRDFIIFKFKIFPSTYDEIIDFFNKLRSTENAIYSHLPDYAYKLRKRDIKLDDIPLFRNISYLNQYIEPQLESNYDKEGNIKIV